jgi:hypothetical protein
MIMVEQTPDTYNQDIENSEPVYEPEPESDTPESTLADILGEMATACEPVIDTNFRNCMIGEAQDRPNLRVYLVSSDTCEGCADSKTELTGLIASGQVEVLDSETELAYNLLEQAEISGVVPALLIADSENRLIGELEIFAEGEEDGIRQ